MKKIIKNLAIAIIAAGAIVAAVIGVNVLMVTKTKDDTSELKVKTTIDYAEEPVETILETEDGELEVIDAPTVDFVDSGKVVDECPEESEECAKGAVLPWLDITSPQTIYNSVINQCIDFDGAYGSQCFDLMAYFQYIYTGRWLSANGTGAAYGIWDARDYNNQGGEYELITDTHDLKAGDWVIFHNGIYGHVGMALGVYNNGYIALLGTNQGGPACAGGGAAANVINMSLVSFSGAFRPKIYIAPEPTPEPESGEVSYTYKTGDTFGQVLVKLGLSDGTDLWGPYGKVTYYNKQLFDQKYVTYYNDQYWGNIPVGSTITLGGE